MMMSSSYPPIMISCFLVITVCLQTVAVHSHSRKSLLNDLDTDDKGIVLPLEPKQIMKMKSWCKTQQYEQVIEHEGCESAKIVNRMCYGQCTSFYIPRYKLEFESCSKCTPTESAISTVKLACQGQTSKIKKVFIVKKCGCRPCNYHNFNDFS